MKILRRLIMLICIIILIPSLMLSRPEGKYYNGYLKHMAESGMAYVIEINRRVKIDTETFIAQRIVDTPESTYLIYTIIKPEQGWTFPEAALRMYDERGREYRYLDGESKGKLWGQEGVVEFDKISQDAAQLVLRFQWYDRAMEMDIPIGSEGVKNEG